MKLTYSTIVHLFHILFVGTLFLYVGIKKTHIPSIMFPFLKYLGIFVILYHSYKSFIRLSHKQNILINLFHVLFVGPLLVYIGSQGNNTQTQYFQLLLFAGIVAISIHGYMLLF